MGLNAMQESSKIQLQTVLSLQEWTCQLETAPLIDWMYRLGSVNLPELLRNGWGLKRANIYLLR